MRATPISATVLDVHVSEVVEQLGGIATRATLLSIVERNDLDRALARGDIVADARGRYALPVADEAVRRAHAMSGLLSLTSAALHHGWEVKTSPDKPHILVPTKRKIAPVLGAAVHLHRGDPHADDVEGIATGKELTLIQCLRTLSFDEALAVADSALRHGESPALLRRVEARSRGPGSRQVQRVVASARPEAANPFESGLRAIALDVPGLHVVPQRLISTARITARPDLVDEELRIILEADSFEWHGGRSALRRDARRYNVLVVEGWLVLRFAWEDVMFDPHYVRSVLIALVHRRRNAGFCTCGAA